MMLATFIYPVLLQPLHLYMQRHPKTSAAPGMDRSEGVKRNSSSVLSTASQSSIDGIDPVEETENDDGNELKLEISPAESELTAPLQTIHTTGAEHPFSPESVTSSTVECAPLSPDPVGTPPLDPDSAPAKTALFGIALVFHTLTNRPLLNLLFTALFHPLAPDVGSAAIRALPRVLCPDGRRIRVDPNGKGSDVESYDFGAPPTYGGRDGAEEDCGAGLWHADDGDGGSETCVFVLSPALADVFGRTVGLGGGEEMAPPRAASPTAIKTHPNVYRRVALACLAGTDGMSTLQSLSVRVTDAVLSSLEGGSGMARDVLFGSRTWRENADPREFFAETLDWGGGPGPVDIASLGGGARLPTKAVVRPNYMIEAVASLCVGVMTAALSDTGTWRLDFDRVAAHTLLCAVAGDAVAKATAVKLVEHRQRQSSSFLSQLPARIDTENLTSLTASQQNHRDGPKAIPEDKNQQRLDLIMDRIFYDANEDSGKCLLEKFVRKRSGSGQDIRWTGPCCVPVATKSSLESICSHLCWNSEFPSDGSESEKDMASSMRTAARSAFAHIQLGELYYFMPVLIPVYVMFFKLLHSLHHMDAPL